MRISTFWTLKSQVWLKPFPALLVWTVLSGSFSGGFSTSLAENAKAEELINADPLKEPSGVWTYPPNMPEAKVEIYKKVGDVELNAYIFNPVGHTPSDKRPVLVNYFGGGWSGGTPGQFYPQCVYLAKRGMVAITVDYRVASRHGNKAQVCVADAKSAIRWVRQNATRLGIDPNRVVAAGESAGGHLAATTATIKGFDEPGEDLSISAIPNLMVLYNPAVQLAPLNDKSPEFSEKTINTIRERAGDNPSEISPSHHVHAGMPPTILFHGEADEAVPVETVKEFARLMKSHGNECQLELFPNRPHGFFNPGRERTPEARKQPIADFRETLLLCDQFLIAHKYLSPKPSTEVPAHIESHENVVYSNTNGRELKLDLYKPTGHKGLRPAVIVVHGGGWLKGDKEAFRPMAIELASRGFVTATIEYRLGGEAKFPAAIQDCNAATRFLRANSEKFGIDPKRIGAVGGSAGGHLVGLMATAPNQKELLGDANGDQSSAIQAAIVLAGPMELATGPVAERSRTGGQNSNANVWFGKTVDQAPELYRLASPLTHISKNTPPMLFLTGALDNPEMNQASIEKLRALHVDTYIIKFRDGNHGCWNRHPYFLPMVDAMHSFFSRHLSVKTTIEK